MVYTQELSPDLTLKNIKEHYPETTEHLQSIGIQCTPDNADLTLRAYCYEHQLDENEIVKWVKQRVNEEGQTKTNIEDADDSESVKTYTKTLHKHEQQCRNLLRELNELVPEVEKIHGIQYPQIKDIKQHFEIISDLMQKYYQFEKNRLLPALMKVQKNTLAGAKYGIVRDLQRTINILKEDQQSLIKHMQFIEKQCKQIHTNRIPCSKFRIMCNNFSLIFDELKEQFQFERKKIINPAETKLNEERKLLN